MDRSSPRGESGVARLARTLRHRPYGLYVAGNSISLVGTWTQRVAVGWLAWDLTGAATWLGIVAFADLFPAIFVGPLAGAVADRVDRLRIIRVAQTLALGQAAALWALTAGGWITPWLLVALVLANGLVMGFNQPARMALAPSLVPAALLGTAVAINSMVFNLARFVGPAVAGVLIVWTGVAGAFAFNALSFLAFLAAVTHIRRDVPVTGPGAGAEPSLLAAVVAGIRYTCAHATLGPLLLLVAALGVGTRPYVELFPGFADAVFGGGPAALATLASSVGAGAVLGGAWLAQRPGTGDLPRVVMASSLLGAGAVLGFALAPDLATAAVFAAVAGLFASITGVASQTLIHLSVESDLRARVLSLYGLIFRAAPAVGALAMGAAADRVGLRAPLALGCGLAALAWLWLWRRRDVVAGAADAAGQGPSRRP